MSEAVLDVETDDFERDVIEESRKRPVVVDFWAAWCGPCRALSPVLEKLATESGGKFLLAKVDVDSNQELATRYRVQGIPAVKAFSGGAVVDEFVGALPESEVRRWLENLVPGPADEDAERGASLAGAGDAAGARAAFEAALQHKPRHGKALSGLARLDLAEGDAASAGRRLDLIQAGDQDRLGSELGSLKLLIRGGGTSLAEARSRLQASPGDDEARLALGRALAAAGEHEAALGELLEIVKRHHREGPGEEARHLMLEIFEAAGARSELSDRFRSLLAAELYR